MKDARVLTVGSLNDNVLSNLVKYLYSCHLEFLKTLGDKEVKEMFLLDIVSVFGNAKVKELLTGNSKSFTDTCNELHYKYINTVVGIDVDGIKCVKLFNSPNFNDECRVLTISDFEKFDKDTILCGEDNLPICMEMEINNE